MSATGRGEPGPEGPGGVAPDVAAVREPLGSEPGSLSWDQLVHVPDANKPALPPSCDVWKAGRPRTSRKGLRHLLNLSPISAVRGPPFCGSLPAPLAGPMPNRVANRSLFPMLMVRTPNSRAPLTNTPLSATPLLGPCPQPWKTHQSKGVGDKPVRNPPLGTGHSGRREGPSKK